MKSFMILIIAILVQSFHMIEHVAQLIQKFVLNSSSAHGILGASLDLEPIHFVYNLIYLSLTVLLFLGFKNTSIKNMKFTYGLIVFVLVFQSWHFIEHVVKLDQHFVEGCLSCPGILGNYYDLIILHFIYNTIAFVPLVIVYSNLYIKIPKMPIEK